MTEQAQKKRIGELLVEGGYISLAQLEEALEVQKGKRQRICNILIDMGYLTEEKYFDFLNKATGAATIDLESCTIQGDIFELIPAALALELEAVPIGRIGNILTVAMVCPLDKAGHAKLEETTGLRVRAILCSRNAVLKTIRSYYKDIELTEPENGEPIEDVEYELSETEASNQLGRVATLVEEIEDLPTLPEILTVISAVINDPGSSASDLARVISSDSALAAKVLKLANSAAYGFSRKISKIQHAVALLGFRETQALAMSVKVFEYFAHNSDFDFKAYWNHAFACGTLARLLSTNIKLVEGESAFAAGLLHDVGKVIIAVNMSDKEAEMATTLGSNGGITRLEAEKRVLGLTHAEAGFMLSEHWFLPAELTGAIRYHHSPWLDPESKALPAVVFLADIFSQIEPEQLKTKSDLPDGGAEALQMLGLSEVALRTTLLVYSRMAPEIAIF